VEFSDAEFAVLDLASEDAEALAHFAYLDGAEAKAEEATRVLSALVQRGLLIMYAGRDDDEPLETEVALRALSDLGPFSGDRTGRWWPYYATTTAAGDHAYRRAYNERNGLTFGRQS
jgi:hypothetical protein